MAALSKMDIEIPDDIGEYLSFPHSCAILLLPSQLGHTVTSLEVRSCVGGNCFLSARACVREVEIASYRSANSFLFTIFGFLKRVWC